MSSSFPYTNSIPNPPNNPSVDAPNLQENTETVNAWVAVDHIGFNNSSGGRHKQVTFQSENSQTTPTDPTSILFTQAGTASSVADLRFINNNGTFPINFIRAYATLSISPVSIIQSFNVSSVSSVGTIITVNLTSGIITGTSYGVIVSGAGATNPFYTIVSDVQFRISIGAGSSNNLTFIVLQL